ncbi:hypothetical protein OsI_35108 [Oryza sativa Indica Group]|uniref:Os11g0148800 protein n=4 Tax=Oryza TaxID=4527 RepID=Q0IUL8_ORYSJ|nr:hypothetical protein OsI_35108 [Oryza sativa Indica Group]EAZ17444.1 hypothetical protein OsJ_32972 [Oryza sativa Japonica Group]BAF27597.1 Os11g0148800 [Oryza sativa Japonica Group]|eukprot:NP_001065752.1 Os11g0148800 [Oryza sativa Japonica Group]
METLPTRGRSNTKKVKASGGSTDEARQLEAKRLSLYSRRNHKRRTTQEITFFGLIWKRSKNDLRSSKLKADDVILRSRDGVGSPMKPTCFLCFKPYRSDLMYIRCESCRNWFHGDALELEEGRIAQLISYRCCRCRRRPLPKCPHSDFYYSKVPEPQPVSQENADDMLSSEEAAGADGDPPLDSSGGVEPTVEETVGANFSANMKSSVPGSVQETIYMDGSSHPTHPVSKGVAKYDGFRAIAAETGSLYEHLRQKDHQTSDDIMITLDKLQQIALHHMKDIACHQANNVVQPSDQSNSRAPVPDTDAAPP